MIPGIQELNQASQALSNLALISPATIYGYGPINALTGEAVAPSFVGNYEGENKVRLESEIPDSYLEDNSAIQDHIVPKPEIITVRFFVGEVSMIGPSLGPVAAQAQTVLSLISAFAPGFSASAMNVINQADQAYKEISNAAAGAVNAWNSLTGNSGPNVITASGETEISPNQTKQQAMFSQVYGYWRNQSNSQNPILWTVQTPWAVFTPCALLSCEATQDETTDMVTEFYLSFKMIRIVNDSSTSLVALNRAGDFASPLVNNGTVNPKSAASLPDFLPLSL